MTESLSLEFLEGGRRELFGRFPLAGRLRGKLRLVLRSGIGFSNAFKILDWGGESWAILLESPPRSKRHDENIKGELDAVGNLM